MVFLNYVFFFLNDHISNKSASKTALGFAGSDEIKRAIFTNLSTWYASFFKHKVTTAIKILFCYIYNFKNTLSMT